MNIAFSVLGDKQLAEDAFQLAFISVAQSLDKIIDDYINDEEKLEKYIKLKVRNAAIDIYRKYRKIRQREISIANEEESDEDDYTENVRKHKELCDDTFEERLFNLLDIENLRKALRSMGEEESVYIKEFYFEGLTTREIAGRHDISLAAAWKRLYRSIDKLRKIFNKLDVEKSV